MSALHANEGAGSQQLGCRNCTWGLFLNISLNSAIKDRKVSRISRRYVQSYVDLRCAISAVIPTKMSSTPLRERLARGGFDEKLLHLFAL